MGNQTNDNFFVNILIGMVWVVIALQWVDVGVGQWFSMQSTTVSIGTSPSANVSDSTVTWKSG